MEHLVFIISVLGIIAKLLTSINEVVDGFIKLKSFIQKLRNHPNADKGDSDR
ncbi:hypothetical protein [Clostridium faecium]|uniref:Holin n=1 Tax=Clostridium faecium TaxID=2762223 RepID=A0ABR8YNJ3_9CLOT|nr:hypothetical protein [Clostridium faecium]MBD8045812.1 hypothetical protein [Clostridium faecium]